MPLISIWSCVPSPTGTGSASEPPCRTRSSSMRAQRGAGGAADVVGPGLQAVELLDDGQRDDDVDVAERVTHDGSAISTDVSSTIRVAGDGALVDVRCSLPVPRNWSPRCATGVGSPVDGRDRSPPLLVWIGSRSWIWAVGCRNGLLL